MPRGIKIENGISNSHPETPDVFKLISLETTRLEGGSFCVRINYRLRNGEEGWVIRTGRDEVGLYQEIQGELHNMFGTRKADDEGFDAQSENEIR